MKQKRKTISVATRRRSGGLRTSVDTAASDETRFYDLGYRFVRSTDPEEQDRLKDEIVKAVLRRSDAPRKRQEEAPP